MKKILSAALLLMAGAAQAEVVVPMYMVDTQGNGAEVGNITLSESPYGLVLTPGLHGLPAGVHGFHLHQNGSCAPGEKDGAIVPALAAGGHYDPAATSVHGAPWGEGHLGDLPPLYVAVDGTSTTAVLAPRVKMTDAAGRALVIHAGGDNHADHPMPLGGGGARVACGVIP